MSLSRVLFYRFTSVAVHGASSAIITSSFSLFHFNNIVFFHPLMPCLRFFVFFLSPFFLFFLTFFENIVYCCYIPVLATLFSLFFFFLSYLTNPYFLIFLNLLLNHIEFPFNSSLWPSSSSLCFIQSSFLFIVSFLFWFFFKKSPHFLTILI